MSLTKVSSSMTNFAPISVLDHGAVGDGVTNDAPAVSAAIIAAFAAGQSTVYFPNGTYYFATPVTVNLDAENALRLVGEAMAGDPFGLEPGGTVISGAAGIESLFIFSKTNLTTAGSYAFETSHIYYKSAALGVSGPLTALKNKIGGSPARPFNVHHCTFLGFDKAIVSDLSSTGGLTTGICQVNIRENTFKSCNYALYGTGGSGAIMDLDFSGNVSENGGRILTTSGALLGTFRIADNLLEGQSDAIILNGGKIAGEITRNYFELNTGTLMNVFASNPNSYITVRDNYIQNSTSATASFRGLLVDCNQNFADASYSVDASFRSLNGKSRINNSGIMVPDVLTQGILQLDYHCVPMNTSVPPGTLTDGAWYSVGGAPEVTPIGSVDVVSIASTYSSYITTTTQPSANDWVVLMCLARTRDIAATLEAYAYTNASSTIGQTGGIALGDVAIGEWVFVLHYIQVTASSAGNMKFRWRTAGGTIDVTQTYVYKVSAPVAGTPLYYCLPN